MSTIMLDKERPVRLTLNAILEFKKQTGIDVKDPASADKLENMSIEDIRTLIWLCVDDTPQTLWEKFKRFFGAGKLTPEKIGNFIDTTNLAEVIGKLNEVDKKK